MVERLLIERLALRLPNGRLIGLQTAVRKLLQDALSGAGLVAGEVHIFHAHQPEPAMRARVQPGGQRSDQRARMQRPGR